MPIRKIGPTSVSVTGTVQSHFASSPLDYESSLERDFLILIDFHGGSIEIMTQPLTIEYEHEGRKHHYTPDVLVTVHNSTPLPCTKHQRCLFEVKYRKDLRKKWVELKPKFRAAKTWAASQEDMGFQVVTEREIRTPALDNVMLLNRAWRLGTREDRQLLSRISSILHAGPQKISDIIQMIGGEPTLIRLHVHHLIRTRWLRTDMSIPITDSSAVRSFTHDS